MKPNEGITRPKCPREFLLAALLLVFFFLANLSIASRSPFGGWMDEVFMVDPGLNLVAGKGWTSSAWMYQTDTEFWAQNSPLYPAGLSLWARLFGSSMVSARAYCYFLGTVGIFFFWLGAHRHKLLTPGYRLFWIVFLATQYSTNWMMRDGRYDVWIFLGLGIAWTGASLGNPATRFGLIFLGCYLAPWAGLISMTYLFLIAGLLVVLTGFHRWREALAGVIGAVAGMYSLFAFYKLMGVWESFWRVVHTLTLAGGWYHLPGVLRIFVFVIDDPGIGLMIAALGILTIIHRNELTSACGRWLALGWSVIILLPCIMMARGMFPTMYFYMIVVPLSLALLVPLSAGRQTKTSRGVAMLMALICLSGLPLRMYFSWREWDYRDPKHIRDFVRAHVKPDDFVYTDYLFYFELRDYVRWYGGPSYSKIIPPDEAARVNVAILDDSDCPDLTRDEALQRALGSGWRKEAVFPTPDMLARLRHPPKSKTTYSLYRRTSSQLRTGSQAKRDPAPAQPNQRD
jgi:hypothetical protein